MLPFETSDIPPEDEEDIDPFAELEIGTKSSYRSGNDALSVFEEEDPLAAFAADDDPLSSFAEEDERVEETVISFTDEKVPELKNGTTEEILQKQPTNYFWKLYGLMIYSTHQK